MEIFERVRILRKQHLKLSQEQFGQELGVARSVIANIEANALARPEQKEPLYRLICAKFNVNYEWLVNGEGEMFVTTKKSFLERLSAEYGLSDTAQNIIECYLSLTDEQRSVVDDFVKSIAETIAQSSESKAGTVDTAIDKSIRNAAISQENDIAADIKNTIQQTEVAFSKNATQKK